jgi:hypothetical protein
MGGSKENKNINHVVRGAKDNSDSFGTTMLKSGPDYDVTRAGQLMIHLAD